MGALASGEGSVDATIVFERRDDGPPLLSVQATADVELVCQRCLRSMTVRVAGASRVGLVESMAQADRLPTDVEPVWLDERRVDLAALVEEELMLALPLVPMHERDDRSCGMTAVDSTEAAQVEPETMRGEAAVKQKPFAELGELLKRGK